MASCGRLVTYNRPALSNEPLRYLSTPFGQCTLQRIATLPCFGLAQSASPPLSPRLVLLPLEDQCRSTLLERQNRRLAESASPQPSRALRRVPPVAHYQSDLLEHECQPVAKGALGPRAICREHIKTCPNER